MKREKSSSLSNLKVRDDQNLYRKKKRLEFFFVVSIKSVTTCFFQLKLKNQKPRNDNLWNPVKQTQIQWCVYIDKPKAASSSELPWPITAVSMRLINGPHSHSPAAGPVNMTISFICPHILWFAKSSFFTSSITGEVEPSFVSSEIDLFPISPSTTSSWFGPAQLLINLFKSRDFVPETELLKLGNGGFLHARKVIEDRNGSLGLEEIEETVKVRVLHWICILSSSTKLLVWKNQKKKKNKKSLESFNWYTNSHFPSLLAVWLVSSDSV